MAQILIVAATQHEVAFLLEQSKKSTDSQLWFLKGSKRHNVDILVTGPGITATTYHLTRILGNKKYDLAINIGICGSFDKTVQPVKLVNIISEKFGDFGAEEGTKLLDIFELGFVKKNEPPFKNGSIVGGFKKKLNCLKAIRQVEAITVQKVTGTDKGIRQTIKKFGKVVESMEGAAFFYVCNMKKVKSIQVRAVSNMVEKRNRKNWKIKEAIDALEGFTGLLLLELENSI